MEPTNISSNIPEAPEPKEVVEKLHQKVLDWIEHFRSVSPRIEVLLPTEELMAELERRTKEHIEVDADLSKVKLAGWPRHAEVAFIVQYDSSMPGEPKKIDTGDISLFCYGDIPKAFALTYFDHQDDIVRGSDFHSQYSLSDWDDDLLNWHFREELIASELLKIQKKVPPFEHLTEKWRK